MFETCLKSILLLTFVVFACACSNTTTTEFATQTEPPIPATNTVIPPTPTQLPTTSPQPSATATALQGPTATVPAPLDTVISSDTWMKTYGGNRDDTVADILLAEDGGFTIIGATNIDFDGDMQSDGYLLQTDPAGDVLWEQVFEGYSSGQAIDLTDDGGLLISGVTSSVTGNSDIFLMKLDPERNEAWSKTFGGPLDEFGAAWQMADGGYILGGSIVDPNDIVVDNPGVAGYGGFSGRSNIYLTRINAEGNEVWSRAFGGENNVMGSSGLMVADGGFLILGTIMHYPENDDDITLLKVDQNGDPVWSLTWEEGNLDGYEVIPTSDGNYLITGGYAPAGDLDTSKKDFLFIKIDPNGNEIWKSIFGDPDVFEWAVAVTETSDGGFVAVGDIVRDLYTWDADILLVKIDQNGKLVWQQTIETNTHTMLTEILEHPEGGYVIAGSTYRRGNFDILLIKTDSEGLIEQ